MLHIHEGPVYGHRNYSKNYLSAAAAVAQSVKGRELRSLKEVQLN